MKQKHKIDKVFNERLNALDTSPSPRVWENIQAELGKGKKERKPIPLWIKLGGVAALIALLLTVGNSLYNTPNAVDEPSITNEKVEKSEKLYHEFKSDSEKHADDSQVASEEIIIQNDATLPPENAQGKSSKNNKAANASNNGHKSTSTQVHNALIAEDEPRSSSSRGELGPQEGINKESNPKLVEGIAASKNSYGHPAEKIIDDIEDRNEGRVSENRQSEDKEGIASKGEAERLKSEKNLANPQEKLSETAKNKKSILEAIAENNEEALAPKKKEKPELRWIVSPNVAPVYYSSLGNGSSIDPNFADNPQKGDVNMSYGVQVSYAINNRLSVRTGLNNFDLSYSTSGIEVGKGPVALALRSVDYGGRDIVVSAFDKGTIANAAPSGDFGDIMLKSTQGDAQLIQNINYYEVPLELKYALLDNKLGVNIIGGMSTLFLGNNEISVKATNYNEVLGEANNLSSVSFSTNVGLGLDYKLSKKFTFNIEPMFKYQLNPYTDSSVNFKPYYLGVYSGFSFKF